MLYKDLNVSASVIKLLENKRTYPICEYCGEQTEHNHIVFLKPGIEVLAITCDHCAKSPRLLKEWRKAWKNDT